MIDAQNSIHMESMLLSTKIAHQSEEVPFVEGLGFHRILVGGMPRSSAVLRSAEEYQREAMLGNSA